MSFFISAVLKVAGGAAGAGAARAAAGVDGRAADAEFLVVVIVDEVAVVGM